MYIHSLHPTLVCSRNMIEEHVPSKEGPKTGSSEANNAKNSELYIPFDVVV